MALRYFLLLILFSILKSQTVKAQECADTKLPTDIVVKRGSRAVLECSAQVLFWTVNGKTINTESNADCSCEVESCGDLVFSNILDEDAGTSRAYRCTIFGENGTQFKIAYICIEELPIFPNFFAPFQGTEGQAYNIILPYDGTCVTLAKVDVLKGGVSVENDTNIQITITNTSVVIAFTALTSADESSYTLNSENIAGIATTSIGLVVKHKPILVAKNVSPGSLLLANSTAILSCNYTAYPMPMIQWFDPNGGEISEGIKTVVKGRWKYSELKLERLTQNDGGSYTCSASNVVGSTLKTIDIQVTGPMNVPWVTDRAANEVTVSWDEPSNEYSISKYRVEYKKITNNGITMWLFGSEVSVGTQQTRISNLQGNTNYMIRVVYFASLGKFYGSPIQFKTLHRAPVNPPISLVAITISNSMLNINWNKPIRTSSDGDSQIISYRLWWASEQNNYESVLIDGSNTQYTLIGLTGSTTYSLKVQAYTKGGFGPNSTVIELATFAETFEFPMLLLESRIDGLNWILEWELDGDTELEVLYYIRITSYSGELFDEIGPLSSNVTSYNFTNLDMTKYFRVCIDVEVLDTQQRRNCTELYTIDPNQINAVNLAVWIATPISGLLLFLCVATTLLCGMLYACRTGDAYTNNGSIKKVESDQSISSKISMNARHPYTGEPLPQAPRSCLKYHSDRGDDSTKLPKQLRIGTEL